MGFGGGSSTASQADAEQAKQDALDRGREQGYHTTLKAKRKPTGGKWRSEGKGNASLLYRGNEEKLGGM